MQSVDSFVEKPFSVEKPLRACWQKIDMRHTSALMVPILTVRGQLFGKKWHSSADLSYLRSKITRVRN